MARPEEYIAFQGRDWQLLKTWLLEQKNNKVGLLIQADTHDKSNQIRGALAMIQQILALEEAANKAALQG